MEKKITADNVSALALPPARIGMSKANVYVVLAPPNGEALSPADAPLANVNIHSGRDGLTENK
jgi:hypothetical protein